MESNNLQNSTGFSFEKIVDIIVRLGILFLLISWCFDILRPFVLILIWAAVIAIAVYPVYSSLAKLFRGKKTLATVVLTLLMLSILIIPSILVTQSLFEGVSHLREVYKEGQPLIPPPGERTANWPVFLKPVVDGWQLASENLQTAAVKYSDKVKAGLLWVLALLTGIGKGVLQFVGSIIIAGVFLAFSEGIAKQAKKIFVKLAGNKGEQFADITVATVRNVVKGILGVAVIQATMCGIGFFMAGVPFAGLWTVMSLIFAIIQVGAGPVAIPVAIYMFSVADTGTATILAVWLTITLVSDNVLKPILLGRGAPAPMLVIFLGAIGGFIYNGFLGLFLGAVILTIGYKLFLSWLDSTQNENLEAK